jgi:hypothetical protein
MVIPGLSCRLDLKIAERVDFAVLSSEYMCGNMRDFYHNSFGKHKNSITKTRKGKPFHQENSIFV